jgi:prolyl-tRNA editing enzyme YbaK/EbsC (Cys-tRNA(Pro) deacylase)
MHPSAERVATVLRERGAGGEVRELDSSARTAAEAAASLGVPVGAIANSLIFATAFGEPLLVLTSGAHRVDTSWLGQRLGVSLRRADADLVRAATGQPIGGVSPVGHPAPVRTLVDTALREFPVVWAAAGTPHAVFPTTFDELVALTNGEPTEVEPYEDTSLS